MVFLQHPLLVVRSLERKQGQAELLGGSRSRRPLAAKLYKKRFSAYARWLHGLGRSSWVRQCTPVAFMFVPKSLKLLHEEVLGEETFVTISLSRE